MPSNPSADEIEALRASLSSSEKEIQSFLEHAVHDLRAARRAVGISTEVLLAEFPTPLGDGLQPAVHQIQQGLARMDAILSGVSNYCLSLRTSAYSRELVPTEMVVRLALAGLEKQVRQTGAIVTYHGLPKVMGDRDQLISLFRYLIDNALKYRGKDAPEVEIRARQDEDKWLFSIQDNGIGIDRKYWDGIFAPFSRLHGPEIPGVGLGLAICRKILGAHHGIFRIESVVGQGSTFFFTIPVDDAATESDGT